MKVKVYWNLHKKCYSVQHKGKVIDHLDRVVLENVEFKVSEAGRQRVLKQKRKNVHAFVVGSLVDHKPLYEPHYVKTVKYNPYKYSSFVTVKDSEPVNKSDIAELYINGANPVIDAYDKVSSTRVYYQKRI